ncbi:MAG TPA: hypothetical protein VHE12_09670 [bacterium]|nr:hypothetical protein [bacterium]
MEPTTTETLGETKLSPISLALDDYEDLFSDFDNRPYAERLLSDDLLFELKRASLDRLEEGLEVLFTIPKDRRNANLEKTIKERMKAHFRRHRRRLEDKLKRDRRTGTWMLLAGVAIMFLATAILFYTPKNFLTSFIVVLLEPAGWFTFWEGLDFIVFRSRESTPDLRFYRKMTGAKVLFQNLPEPPAPPRPKA